MPRSRATLALALATLSASCGDESKEAEFGAEGDGVLYMAATRVWDDTSTTSYFHLFDSITPDTKIDVKQALEVPGAAKLLAYGDLGWFAIGEGESPTITRYTLDDEGKLQKGGSISLQPYGVMSLWGTLYFVSADKAYCVDPYGSQLIVLNPSKMEITGTIALPQTAREGFVSYYGATSITRGSELIFSVGWFDWGPNDTVRPETGLVAVDTGSDEVLRFETDPRCAGITHAITMADGDTYFVSSALAAAAHRLGRLDTKPCALRIRAGERAFDPDYLADLGELTKHAMAGEPMPGGDGAIVLRLFDETMGKVKAEGQATYDLTGQAAWRWARWDVHTNALTMLSEIAPSTSDAYWFELEGKVFASETRSDYSETTLVEIPADGKPARALSMPGFLQNIARIR